MILQQCTETKGSKNREVFNQIAKLEQTISIKESIINSPIISTEGRKVDLIKEIIRIVEFFTEVTGKKMESYQIQVLAGDLYKRFRNDTIDDLIMMFSMIRTGELGKVGYTETFNEKVMLYVDLYMNYKSEIREKIVNDEKRERKKADANIEMTDEAYAKFTELQSLIRIPALKKAETFSIKKALASVDSYLETLPETCQNLKYSDLLYEIKRTQYSNKTAWEILLQEKERRKKLKKKK